MRVIIVAAMTICGRISPPGMGSGEDRRVLERLRDKTGASLIGAATLREADPEMRGSGGRLPENRIRAVITGAGNVPSAGRKLFSCPPAPVVFTSCEASARLAARLNGAAEVFSLPPGPCGLSVAAALSRLAALGARSVLVEGGGKLNYAVLAEGLVDEICLTVTPKLSGHREGAALVSGPLPLGAPFLDLELRSCRTGRTGEIFCHYRRRKG